MGATLEVAEERDARAWTSLCRILFASNEFIYVD